MRAAHLTDLSVNSLKPPEIGQKIYWCRSLKGFGIELTPFQLSVWAIPTAICAFLIHGTRLLLLDRKLGRRGQ